MKAKVWGALLSCMVLITIIVSGCGISAIDGMTGEQLLDNILAADKNLNSCKMYMTSQMDMMGFSFEIDGYGAFDRNSMEMYMVMDTDVLQDSSKVYIVDDWMYMEIAGMGWIKMELTTGTWEQQDITAQQIMLLENSVDMKILGREQISSMDCYKIEVKPDMQALWDWAMEQGDMDELEYDIDLNEFFKDVNMTVWIATDTFYLVQWSMDITMKSFGRMIQTVTLYDFNIPVEISLPASAADAEEWDMLGW